VTIFQNLVERRSTSGDRLISQFIGSRLGNQTRVTGYSALTHSSVFACTALIADGVSTLPVQTYQKTQGQRLEVDRPPIIDSPSAFISDVDWRRQIIMSWMLAGNAFGQKIKMDRQFRPEQVELFDPFSVSVTEDPDSYRLIYRVNGKEIDPDLIVHFPGLLLPGQRVGVTPIEYAATQIGMGLNAQKFGQDYFVKGAKANGVINMPQAKGSPEQAQELKERFVESAQNAHEPIVLFGDTKYTPLNMSAADTQFLEAANASGQDVARFFSVPAELIGLDSGSSMTYSNIESRSRHALQYTLNPWIVRLEKALTSLVAKPTYVKANRDAALSIDTTTRYNANQIGIRTGFLTVNEVRALEDRPPVENGNITLWPPYASGQPGQEEPIGQNNNG
jgi:HK97 family phage portal protein